MNIKEKLQNLFSKKEYYEDRKIVFWIDDNKDFKEEFENIELEGVNKIILHKNNFFTIKYLLEIEKPNENFLIYVDADLDLESKENWLIDIYLYSEKFFADKISIIMDELNISFNLRNFVFENKTFFNNKNRVEKLKKIKSEFSSQEELYIAMLCVLSGLDYMDFEESLKRIFIEELNEENKIFENIKKFSNEKDFWEIIKNHFGYDGRKDLKQLLYAFFITDLSKQLSEDYLINFNNHIFSKKANNIIVFINHWRNSINKNEYKELSEKISKELGLKELLEKKEYSFEEIIESETFAFFDEFIIKKIIDFIKSGILDFDKYINIIEKRRTKFWYDNFKEEYEGLYYYLKMYEFMNKTTFAFDNLKEGVENYKKSYYLMDLYYRKFYLNYNRKLDSILRDITKDVERFNNEYNSKLNEIWDEKLSDLNGKWEIEDVKHQQYLFSKYIPIDKKTVIIFSDALRYEIGIELSRKLNSSLSGKANIEPMLSVLPSITSLGMAVLMPNVNKNGIRNNIKIKENSSDRNSFYVMVNNKYVSSFEDRRKLLEEKEDIVVFKYKDFLKLSKDEKRERVKGKKYILIYHNTVDEVGDNAKSEDEVFEACERAINELYDLVKNIKNNLNISNIIITADHGFIYQVSDLEKLDTLEKLNINSVVTNRRFILSKDDVKEKYVHKFSLSYIDNPGYFVYIPKGNLRFKIQGGGSKYVHGGATPQEIIIPLISYTRSRYSEKPHNVKIELLNSERKITNNEWKLRFFQNEPVSDKVLPSTYKIYFEDKNHNVISEKIEIIADIKNSDNSKRIIERNIRIRSNTASKTIAYLIVENIETQSQEMRREFEIDIAFPDEF